MTGTCDRTGCDERAFAWIWDDKPIQVCELHAHMWGADIEREKK